MDRAKIDRLFEGEADPQRILEGILRHTIPAYDQVVKFGGLPLCSDELWRHVCMKFVAHHERHNLGGLPGKLWYDWGFEPSLGLRGNEVILPRLKYRCPPVKGVVYGE